MIKEWIAFPKTIGGGRKFWSSIDANMMKTYEVFYECLQKLKILW